MTIPAAVRRLLGRESGGPVEFVVEGGETFLRKVLSLEESFGSLTPINRPEDVEALSRIAKEEVALRYLEKMRRWCS